MTKFKTFLENEDMPIFLMTIGIPGSGKSTWLKKQTGFEIVCPDDIRKELTGNISDQSQNAKVWQLASDHVIAHLKNGKNVILDATNVNSKSRKQFIEKIPKDIKYRKQAKIFTVSPEEAKKRIKKDIESGVDRSNVPDDVIDRMFQQFTHTISNLEQEGFQII